MNINRLVFYYRKSRPFHHRFLKEIFSSLTSEKVDEYIRLKKTVGSEQSHLDDAFLFEARHFLRLSIFNLLAYKHLMCSKYLAWGKVTLYYSYFYSISSLLRLDGKAIVHLSNVDPKQTKTIVFQLERQTNSHNYLIKPGPKNEHTVVWNTFSDSFPHLSKKETARLVIQDRMDWNYSLPYPSQATEPYALDQTNIYCEHNFLDPDFEVAYTAEQAEHIGDLVSNYGYEEMYGGDLIKEVIGIFVAVAKGSEYKNDYASFLKYLIEEMNQFETKQATREEIGRWLQNGVREITSSL